MIELEWIDMPMSVCRVVDFSGVDRDGEYVFTARTRDEYSLVCPTRRVPDDAEKREDGWRMFRVCGALEFSLVGILAGISGALAQTQIPLFVLSTYDTDYVLVREEYREHAEKALAQAGYCWKMNRDNAKGK